MVDLRGGEGEEVEGHVCQRDYGQHAIVTIGFNEVVTGDGCGVYVVLSKWSYKGLSKDGQIHWSPRISTPVNNSWRKVGGEYSCHNAQHDVPQMSQMEIGKEVNEIEGHEREAEDNTYPFLTSFAWRV